MNPTFTRRVFLLMVAPFLLSFMVLFMFVLTVLFVCMEMWRTSRIGARDSFIAIRDVCLFGKEQW